MASGKTLNVMTVGGEIPAAEMGGTLPHEHILVGDGAYEEEDVVRRVLPYLKEARAQGWETFVECTANHIGRAPLLLKKLSALSGLHILTNTGFYGGQNEAILPKLALEGTERELADFWIREFREGIGGTGVRPGFIKISVNRESLTEMSKKLVRAAGITHLETGLTIMSHTGPGIPAMEQIEILKSMGVSPSAFIWTHAQDAERNGGRAFYLRAAKEGAWISLDDIDDHNTDEYVDLLGYLKAEGRLHRVLLSHDAGWYKPGEENGGSFRGFGTLKDKLLPALRDAKFTDEEIELLIRKNPAEAFGIRIRPLAAKS